MKVSHAESAFVDKKEIAKIALIVCVGIPLTLFVWRENVRHEQARAENLTFLRSLRASSIRDVTVSDSHGTVTKIVTDAAALAALADALHATQVYEPNHPSYTHNFVVTVSVRNGTSRRYDWHTIFPADETIYIDFPHGGNGKSRPLYNWMREEGLL